MPAAILERRSTGIVRKIDDLGRVVIPKELRRTMRIREGDPMEIFTMGNMICFEKYSVIATLESASKRVAKAIYKLYKMPVGICDVDKFIISAGNKHLKGKRVNPSLLSLIQNNKHYARKETDHKDVAVLATEEVEPTIVVIAACPVHVSMDLCGALCLMAINEGHSWPTATQAQIDVLRAFATVISDELTV